jgi:tetratricopeptide (TPR) repeat protein
MHMNKEESLNQEKPSQDTDAPDGVDSRRVEETTQAILRAVEEASSSFWGASVHGRPKNRLADAATFVASTWVVFFAVLTGASLIIGWLLYDVSPLNSVQRIAAEQQQNEFEQAENQRAQAQVQTKKDIAQYHVELGHSLLSAGQPEAAKAEYDKALEIDPVNVEARKGSLKSELFISLEPGEYDPGVMQQRMFELREEYPNDTHIASFAGDVFAFYDQETALEQYRQAIELDQSNAMAHYGIGNVYYGQGKYEKALPYIKTAYDLANWNPAYQYAYAQVLYELARYDDALVELGDITTWDWQFMWSYADLTHVYRLTGDLELSHWYGRQFIELLADEEIASLDRNAGTWVFAAGPGEFTVGLAEDPEKKYYAYYNMALTSYLMGKTGEAESYANKAQAIQMDPDVRSEVDRLLNYYIDRVKEEQNFDTKAEEFRALYL